MVAFDVVKKDKTIYVPYAETRYGYLIPEPHPDCPGYLADAEESKKIMDEGKVYSLETNMPIWTGKPDLTWLLYIKCKGRNTGWFRMEFLRDDNERVIGLVSAIELANIVMAYEKSRPDPILLGVASKGGSLTLKVFGDY